MYLSVCMSIDMFRCLYVHQYYVHPLLHLYICQYIYTSINTILIIFNTIHACQITLETISHLIFYLDVLDVVHLIYSWDIFSLYVCSDMPSNMFVSLTSRVAPVGLSSVLLALRYSYLKP